MLLPRRIISKFSNLKSFERISDVLENQVKFLHDFNEFCKVLHVHQCFRFEDSVAHAAREHEGAVHPGHLHVSGGGDLRVPHLLRRETVRDGGE